MMKEILILLTITVGCMTNAMDNSKKRHDESFHALNTAIAATRANMNANELESRQYIQDSDVQDIQFVKWGNTEGYFANLKNGSNALAQYIVKGPNAGEFYGRIEYQDDTKLTLPEQTYNVLMRIYKLRQK